MADPAREAGRLLLAVVDTRTPLDRVRELTLPHDLGALVEIARVHRVLGVVHQRLVDAGVDLPEPLGTRLGHERMVAAARQLDSYQTVAAIVDALDQPLLVVKGPVLGAVWYGDPSLRTFRDIDVLVRRRDFGEAIGAFARVGLTELSANWRGFLDHEVAEIPLAHRRVAVDVHWDLIAIGTVRREFSWDMEPLFGRAEMVEVGLRSVATLDPGDTLLHLCINGGLDGARTLIRLVDIDVVARSGRVDWSAFGERARAAGAGALCAAVLQRCRSLVGTPIPSGVLAELEPFGGWLSLNAFVDQRRRTGRRLRSGVASGVLIATGRASRRATAHRLTRTLASHAMTKLGRRPPLTATGGELDWQRVEAEPDVEVERQDYLRWAARVTEP